MSEKCCMLVCGGGNGAHAMAGLGNANTEVRVLTLFADEAERWTNTMKTNDFVVHFKVNGKEVKAVKRKPDVVSKDPAIAKGCNMIVLVVPAFGHAQYFEAIKPYVAPGTAIIGMPGQAGFEFDVRGILGDVAKDCCFGNFDSLPWAARITQYGQEVDVLGTKACMSGAMEYAKTPTLLKDPVASLQNVLGDQPVLNVSGHILGMTLMSGNAYVHPAILYAKWKDYNGEEFSEAPLFYQGMDQFGADTMEGLCDEVMETAKFITAKYPDIDMSNVFGIFRWYLECYSDEIVDKSTLFTAITTNKAYIGLAHPMVKVDGDEKRLVPDFNHRYFTEDVPYGMVCLRGIAEAAGVPTPINDKVLLWMQAKLGKEYLKDGKIAGKDVASSRCPQRYGFNTLEAVLGK